MNLNKFRAKELDYRLDNGHHRTEDGSHLKNCQEESNMECTGLESMNIGTLKNMDTGE